MREILFRGKTFAGKWIEGFLFQACGDCVVNWCISRTPLSANDYSDILGDWAEVFPETVGQYTGLTDKNGKKIFEGDIVKTDKFNTPNKHYIIKYDLLLGAFIGEDDGTMYFTTFDGDSELFEVIGNIYDDAELLKGGADNDR